MLTRTLTLIPARTPSTLLKLMAILAGRIRAFFYYGKGLFSQQLKAVIVKECGPLE
jgi:hypothetical protein